MGWRIRGAVLALVMVSATGAYAAQACSEYERACGEVVQWYGANTDMSEAEQEQFYLQCMAGGGCLESSASAAAGDKGLGGLTSSF